MLIIKFIVSWKSINWTLNPALEIITAVNCNIMRARSMFYVLINLVYVVKHIYQIIKINLGSGITNDTIFILKLKSYISLLFDL